eukprot:22044-Pelagomonas_calceolata.AAC.3
MGQRTMLLCKQSIIKRPNTCLKPEAFCLNQTCYLALEHLRGSGLDTHRATKLALKLHHILSSTLINLLAPDALLKRLLSTLVNKTRHGCRDTHGAPPTKPISLTMWPSATCAPAAPRDPMDRAASPSTSAADKPPPRDLLLPFLT